MPTIIAGDAATAATLGINANRRVVDMKDRIYLLEPSANPLTLLVNKVRKQVSKSPKFEWIEDEAFPILDAFNGTFTTTTITQLVVDNGSYFAVNSTIKDTASGEVMLVTAVDTNTLSVTRSWGGTAAAAIGDNDPVLIMGGAAAENATSETSREVKTAAKYNYSEIVRSPFGVSGTLMASELYGGNALAYLHKARGIDHAKAIELKFLFGERAINTSGNNPRRSTGGLWEVISTNSKDFGGSPSMAEVEAAAVSDFRYGRKSKMLFLARAAASLVSGLAHGLIEVVPTTKTFGIAVSRYITVHGVYNMVVHDLFVGADYDEIGMVVDLDNVGYRYLRDRDTKLKTNIQTPGQDGRKDEYLSEVGLERILEKTHGKWVNVST